MKILRSVRQNHYAFICPKMAQKCLSQGLYQTKFEQHHAKPHLSTSILVYLMSANSFCGLQTEVAVWGRRRRSKVFWQESRPHGQGLEILSLTQIGNCQADLSGYILTRFVGLAFSQSRDLFHTLWSKEWTFFPPFSSGFSSGGSTAFLGSFFRFFSQFWSEYGVDFCFSTFWKPWSTGVVSHLKIGF